MVRNEKGRPRSERPEGPWALTHVHVWRRSGPAYCRSEGDCAGALAWAEVDSSELVINCTSTRRFLARPAAFLFSATGLSLPRPIRYIRYGGTLCFAARYWITASARRRLNWLL